MPYKRIKDSLPGLYHGVLPEQFDNLVPEETFADCPNCPMVCSSRDELNDELAKPFAPDTKCCTYHPDLPNYLVGGLLSDDDPSLRTGRERILAKIRGRIGVFPHGIYAPRLYKMMYDNGRQQGFGRSTALRCPYYAPEIGGCSVWKYREAICATWFCKHVASEKGKTLWNGVLEYLRHAQQAMVEHVLLEHNLPVENPYSDEIMIEDLDGLPPYEKEYNRRWGQWAGREEEFYIASYQTIRSINAAKFAELTGVRQRTLLDLINKSYQDIVTLPEFLIIDNESPAIKRLSEELYQITLTVPVHGKKKDMTYNVPIPARALDLFDGKTPTEEAWDSLGLDDEILLALFHHEILVSK